MFLCLFLLILDSLLGCTDGQTLNQSIDLMNEKLTGYDRRHRPIENQSLALQVSLFRFTCVQTYLILVCEKKTLLLSIRILFKGEIEDIIFVLIAAVC